MTASARGVLGSALAAAAAPDVYRANAFRLSGLPVDASARHVRRLVTELEAGDRLGAEWTPPPSPGRPSPGPDRAEVHRALQRLRDPARRIVDELFWLWPMPGGGIGGDDLDAAGAVWADAAEGPDPEARAVALHNRAVAAHVKAAAGGTDAKHEVRWRRAYQRWRLAIGEDACWDHLRSRVTAIGDPRLSPDDVGELRELLPQALLALHARLAVDAVESGRDDGGRQLQALRRSGFDEHLIDTVLRASVETHAARVRTAVERLRADRLDGEGYQASVQRALACAEGADRRVLRRILGEEDDLTAGVADELASSVRECVVAELNGNRGEHPAVRAAVIRNNLPHLEAALDLAVGANARTHIVQDLAVVLNNLVVAMCDAALEDGEVRPENGHALQSRLHKETRAHIARIAILDPDARDRVCDDVVGTSLVLLFKYVTKTRDVQPTIDALRRLRPRATAPDLCGELDEAIRSLLTARLTAGPWPGDRPDPDRLRRFTRVEGGTCVLCARRADTEREVQLVGYGTDGIENHFVMLPSCRACAKARITTGWQGAVIFLAVTIALAIGVFGGFATHFTFDGLIGPLLGLAGVVVLAVLAGRGARARRRVIAAHPEIRIRLARRQWISR